MKQRLLSTATLAEETQLAAGTTLEEALPHMLEGVLAGFQEVGVQRILALADQMARACMEEPRHAALPGGRC